MTAYLDVDLGPAETARFQGEFKKDLVNYFAEISGLHLVISCGVVLFASALILWETSQVIHGGETNYIRATVGLYVSIYNLFTSLLHLLGAFGDD